jgi:hypothetical protein
MTDDDLRTYGEETSAALDEITSKHPGIQTMTAIVMASDLVSMRRWRKRADAGEVPYAKSVNLVGSYYRWQYAYDLWCEGKLTDREFFTDIADRWRGADPDDTDPRWIEVWQKACDHFDVGYIRDGKALPLNHVIRVYRGEQPGDKPGIAWTLNTVVATKFALGAGLRHPMRTGIVIGGTVRRHNILAYLTGRNEYEVIIDPKDVHVVTRAHVRA